MKKFAGLELCRFLCALSVILWHYPFLFIKGVLANDSIDHSRTTYFPLHEILFPFYDYGYNAVLVFWVISGFIFFWKYGNTIYQKTITGWRFFTFRFSRLYPLHIATLITVAVLQYLYNLDHGTPFIYDHNNVLSFLSQLVLASNWLQSQPFSFNGPIWSISTEILAYIAFFAIARIAKPTLALCVIMVGITKLAMHYHSQLSQSIMCIHFFFAGGLSQQLLMRLNKAYYKLAFWIAGGIVTSASFIFYAQHAITSTLLLIFSVGVVSWFALLESANGVNVSKWNWLGDLTYSSYLLHFPLQLTAVLVLDGLGIDRRLFASPFALILFVAATFGLSWMVYRRFEMPAQCLIRTVCAGSANSKPNKLAPVDKVAYP